MTPANSESASPLQPYLLELLAEQQRLDTPVARFSAAHDRAGMAAVEHRNQPQLLPLTAPRPGEQYAFEVDLDACTGCKSCVAACHSLNGLDETETWRDVGMLVSSEPRRAFTQTVTSACHHCEDPACLNGCPVLAYEKDPLTGIVRHLDDQCIGCSYCVLKCPYDVPKYSSRLGIVRKCDMCHGRLAHGEAPACAQACPTSAIRITTVAIEQPHSTARVGAHTPAPFLPAAPDPSYTRPTTRYLSRRTLPADVVAADAANLSPQPAHWPLVLLLTSMPFAVGTSVFAALDFSRELSLGVTLAGWGAAALGLATSVLHLGQPRRAWRVFLGLRRSWLSREAVVFGAWFTMDSLVAVGAALAWTGTAMPVLRIATAVVGIAGLFCSAMIYADTRRQFWRLANTAPRFFGTAVVLTLATAVAESGRLGLDATTRPLALLTAIALGLKLAWESQALSPLNGDRDVLTPALKTARLLTGPLRGVNEARNACAVLAGILGAVVLALYPQNAWLGWPVAGVVAVGEMLERSLFFRAVVAPKMPGVPA